MALPGYKCHRKIAIRGSTAGVQTDYQMKVVVHKGAGAAYAGEFPYVSKLSGVIPVDPAPDHAEGVCSDGTWLYASSRHDISKMSKLGVIDTTYTDKHLDGTPMTQVNGIYLKGDYFYVGSNNYNVIPKYGYIKVYNKSDMSYYTEHQVKDHWCEGATYYKGSWWVTYWDWMFISRYNDSWEWVADYALSLGETHVQGIFTDEEYLYLCCSDPEDSLAVYRWTGAGAFVALERSPISGMVAAAQSGGKEPGEDYVWIVDQVLDGTPGDIFKYNLNYNHVFLNDHCQGDFADIRFTKSDGITELDHWLQDYTVDDKAIFWVEFNSIPVSPNSATFYICCGNAVVGSGSNGVDTFILFDDFLGGALDGAKWQDAGWAGYAGVSGFYTVAGSLLTITGDGGYRVLVCKHTIAPGDNKAIFLITKRANLVSVPHYAIFDGIEGGAGYTDRVCVNDKGLDGDWDRDDKIDGVIDEELAVANFPIDTWFIVQIKRYSTTKLGIGIFEDDWISLYEHSGDHATWDIDMHFLMWVREAVDKDLDWFVIRNFIDPEPTWGTWGDEVCLGGGGSMAAKLLGARLL